MQKAKPITFSPLVAKAYALLAEIAAKTEALSEIEAQLIKQGAGRYCDDGEMPRCCTVVAATAAITGAISYELPEGQEDDARRLAGEKFGDLFDRRVTYSPCKSFEDITPKLLPPARAQKLIALCLVPGKEKKAKDSYVIWK